MARSTGRQVQGAKKPSLPTQALPLDQQYKFGSADRAGTGRNVTIYALDSGIRLSHKEFLDWPNTTPRVSYGCALQR